MSFKFTVELCVMTMKSDTKIQEELPCRFKIDMNLKNFDPSTRKVKTFFVLIGSLRPKYILFELQKYRGVILHDDEELCKFWRKTDQWFEKDMRNLANFHQSTWKVSKLELWWDPFVQIRKGMNLNLQRSYVSWQWTIMRNLKRNWLFISKLTWGI